MTALHRFHGSVVGKLARPVWVCAACGGWHDGKPEFYCNFGDCAGTTYEYFPSRAEAKVWASLLLRQRIGEIKDIERQPHYPLLVITPEGKPVKIGTYVGDFRFKMVATGATILMDAKGADTHISALKRKFVEAAYGIEVRIVVP